MGQTLQEVTAMPIDNSVFLTLPSARVHTAVAER